MKKLNLDFILFDLIGTTIQDTKDNGSLILACFFEAFQINGLQVSYDELNQQRGKSKRSAIQDILLKENLDPNLTDKIYDSFMALLNHNIAFFSEISNALAVFTFVKNQNIKVGIGSGLPLIFMKKVIHQVGWQLSDFDYINSSDELGEGRPSPLMIFDAMHKLGITNPEVVLKIGDTKVDIQEGLNAKTHTAMVLTGTQTEKDLNGLKPDFIFNSIQEITQIL